MEAAALLAKLRHHGLKISLAASDKVAISPSTLLTPELRQEILAHKPEVLALLSEEREATKELRDALVSLRAHLPPSMVALNDEQLLALANWAILSALSKALERMQ